MTAPDKHYGLDLFMIAGLYRCKNIIRALRKFLLTIGPMSATVCDAGPTLNQPLNKIHLLRSFDGVNLYNYYISQDIIWTYQLQQFCHNYNNATDRRQNTRCSPDVGLLLASINPTLGERLVVMSIEQTRLPPPPPSPHPDSATTPPPSTRA